MRGTAQVLKGITADRYRNHDVVCIFSLVGASASQNGRLAGRTLREVCVRGERLATAPTGWRVYNSLRRDRWATRQTPERAPPNEGLLLRGRSSGNARSLRG